MSNDPFINKVIFSKYRILKKIGKGSFGTIYSGIILLTKKEIAIKIEKRDKIKQGILEKEAHRLIYIQGEGIPKIYCFGNNMTHNLLIMELLGKSLDEIFNSIKKFSLKTICVLGIEMIKRIKYLHNKNHIHRDIKPENFLIGRNENSNKIYLIDFGLSKKYFSKSKNEHIKFSTGKGMIGTARYCSRNTHKGFELGRRDDIESIGYVLIYFFFGSLPWQKLKIKQGENYYDKVGKKKINTSFEDLTKGLPQEFLYYFKYVDSLNFEDEPNYDFLIGLFQEIINKNCFNCYYDFDWNKDSKDNIIYPPLNQENKNENVSKDISLIANKDESKFDVSDNNSYNDLDKNIIIQSYEDLKKKNNKRRSKSIINEGKIIEDLRLLKSMNKEINNINCQIDDLNINENNMNKSNDNENRFGNKIHHRNNTIGYNINTKDNIKCGCSIY